MDSKSKVLDYITTDITPEFFIKPGDQALSRLLLFQFSSKVASDLDAQYCRSVSKTIEERFVMI